MSAPLQHDSFKQLGLNPKLLPTLTSQGYETPTHIQAECIPVMLAGRDLLGQASTGTGKTAAFALPILSNLDEAQIPPQALILTPTRELALQVSDAFHKYAKNAISGFRALPIYGGTDYRTQLSALKRGVHVVVGTPGRILDHLNRGTLVLSQLKTVVLDEADVYGTLIPNPIQAGIGRMFNNFYEPSRVINDILQGEIRYAYQDSARFVLNSTFGLVGFLDVGERVGFPLHQQDFGITMARWGWKQSSFIVMPFIGVYTFRDLVAVPCNVYAFTFWPYIEPENLAWKLYFLEKVETRAELRPVDKVIDEAFDPYVFVRDAYLQKRANDIKTQSNARVASVTPAQESVEEKDNATKVSEQKENKTTKKERRTFISPQKKSEKNLPDVISLRKNPQNAGMSLALAHESMG